MDVSVISSGGLMAHRSNGFPKPGSLGYFLREREPGAVHFAITNQCDSRCSTCRFWRNDDPTHVDLDDAMTAMDVLAGNGVRLVSITGGEPFCHPQLVDICKGITRRGMMVSYLPTNGRAVTEDTVKELVRAGVNIVGVSVDPHGHTTGSRTRDVDDAMVTRARETLEDQGVRTYAGILLTDRMLPISDCLDRVSEMGFSRAVFSYPQIDDASPYEASVKHPMLDLDPLYVSAAVDQIKRARRRFHIYNPDETLDDLVRAYRGEPQAHTCLGGDRILYLDWDLQVRRCFKEPRSLGSVLDMDHLPRSNGGCTSCTQQAFRDLSYVLRAYDRFHSIKDRFIPGRVGNVITRGPGWMGEMRTLFQLLTGGFV